MRLGTRIAAVLSLATPALAQATPFGSGCPGGSGETPALSSPAAPYVGTVFSLKVTGAPANATGVLAVGASNTSWGPLPLPLPLGPFGFAGCQLLVSQDLSFPIQAGSDGAASFEADASTIAAGLDLFVQAMVFDPGPGTLGGLTNGLRLRTLAPPPLFRVAMLPDTQHYSDNAANMPHYLAQTQWIVDNRVSQNIAFATLVGDIVHNGAQGSNGNAFEWENADSAMDILDGDLQQNPDGHIPYAAVVGNHDFDVIWEKGSANQYLTYFGPSRYQGRTWFVGASPSQINMAQIFQGSGLSFLSIGLEWLPSDAAIAWAQKILDENPDLPAIVSTHQHLKVGNPGVHSPAGETPESGGDNSAFSVYTKLVEPYPQIFLVLSGHFHGNGRRTSTTAAGQLVHEVEADYQQDPNGGNGWMQLPRFRSDLGRIEFRTFSPTYTSGTPGPNRAVDPDSNFDLAFDLLQHRADLASTTTLHFRRGHDGGYGVYTGALDTHVGDGDNGEVLPGVPEGGKNNIRSQTQASSDDEQGLLRFDDIVGLAPGRIPPGTTIQKAILTLTTESPSADSPTGAGFHRMLVPWSESSTWNSMGQGIQIGTEALATPDANSAGAVDTNGTDSFDVTTSVQAWVDGTPNWGWVLHNPGTNLWKVRSSDWATLAERPMLTVIY